MGEVLVELKRFDEAKTRLEEALDMALRLYPKPDYPNGHDTIASGFDKLGRAFIAKGSLDRARKNLESALAMRRRLYPPRIYPAGHPEVAPKRS